MNIDITVKPGAAPKRPEPEPAIYTATYRAAARLGVSRSYELDYQVRHRFAHVAVREIAPEPTVTAGPITMMLWQPWPLALLDDDLALFLAAFVDAVEARIQHDAANAVTPPTPPTPLEADPRD